MTFKRNPRWIPLLAALVATGVLASPITPSAKAPAADPHAIPDAFDDPEVPLPDPDLWQRIRKGFLLEPLDSLWMFGSPLLGPDALDLLEALLAERREKAEPATTLLTGVRPGSAMRDSMSLPGWRAR